MHSQNNLPSINSFDKLPIDVLINIFSNLPLGNIPRVSQVSKKFKKVVSEYNIFWEERFKRHFPHIFSKLKTEDITNITNSNGWYAEFRKVYHEEYQNLHEDIKNLFSLVKEENVDGVKKAIKKIKLTDLDKRDNSGKSLLEWAKETGNQKILDLFYQLAIQTYTIEYERTFIQRFKGEQPTTRLDVTRKDENKRSILHWAIRCKQPTSTIKDLIDQEAGTDVELCLAAIEGQAELLIELLIKKGFDPNSGATLLLVAVVHNHKNVVDELLKHGAKFNIPLVMDLPPYNKFKFKKGDTAFEVAIKLNRIDMVEEFLKQEQSIEKLQLLLELAAVEGKIEIAKLLINKGVRIRDRNPETGNYPLFLAAQHGHQDFVNKFLNNGKTDYLSLMETIILGRIDLVKQIIDGETLFTGENDLTKALHVAASVGQAKIVKLLIKKGAKVNECDEAGANALLLAIEHNHKKVVEVLLANKADINTQLQPGSRNHDKIEKGDTPLHVAAKFGDEEMVKLLIDKGANLDTVNETDQNALSLAFKYGTKEVIKVLLLSDHKISNTSLIAAIYIGSPIDNIGKILQALGEDPDLNTALFYAAKHGKAEIAEFLIKKGANVNATHVDGVSTALSYAVRHNQQNVVKILLENNADITIPMPAGDTPLHAAIKLDRINLVEDLVKHLVKHLRSNATTKEAKKVLIFLLNDVLSLAAKQGKANIVELLIRTGGDIDINGVNKALNLAIEQNHKKVVDVIRKHKKEMQKEIAIAKLRTITFEACNEYKEFIKQTSWRNISHGSKGIERADEILDYFNGSESTSLESSLMKLKELTKDSGNKAHSLATILNNKLQTYCDCKLEDLIQNPDLIFRSIAYDQAINIITEKSRSDQSELKKMNITEAFNKLIKTATAQEIFDGYLKLFAKYPGRLIIADTYWECVKKAFSNSQTNPYAFYAFIDNLTNKKQYLETRFKITYSDIINAFPSDPDNNCEIELQNETEESLKIKLEKRIRTAKPEDITHAINKLSNFHPMVMAIFKKMVNDIDVNYFNTYETKISNTL